MKPLFLLMAALAGGSAVAAPTVSRLTPPSELFASGQPEPVIARFLPGQRFDLQATVKPDDSKNSSSPNVRALIACWCKCPACKIQSG